VHEWNAADLQLRTESTILAIERNIVEVEDRSKPGSLEIDNEIGFHNVPCHLDNL